MASKNIEEPSIEKNDKTIEKNILLLLRYGN